MSECKHEWYLKGGRGYVFCGVCCKTVPVENHIEYIEQENTDLRAKLEAAGKKLFYILREDSKDGTKYPDLNELVDEVKDALNFTRSACQELREERDMLDKDSSYWRVKASGFEQERDDLRQELLELKAERESDRQECVACSKHKDKLESQNAALRGALEFYAEADNYEEDYTNNENGYECNDEGPIYHDMGERAREALSTAPAEARTTVIDTAKLYIGVPFVWGGDTPNGFDCSGFTQYVMKENGITIPRTVAEQYKCGTPVSKDNLKPGDLIFFTTYEVGATHVGIYINEDKFIHASLVPEPGQVMVSSLIEQYYAERYIGARRYAAQKALTASGDNRYSRIEEAAKVVRDIAQCYKDGDCGFNEVIEVIDNLTAALGER